MGIFSNVWNSIKRVFSRKKAEEPPKPQPKIQEQPSQKRVEHDEVKKVGTGEYTEKEQQEDLLKEYDEQPGVPVSTEETEKVVYTSEKTELEKKNEKEQNTYQNIRNLLAKYPKITFLKNYLPPSETIITEAHINPLIGTAVRDQYNWLLMNKATIRDPDIYNLVYEHRDRIQHRFSNEAKIMGIPITPKGPEPEQPIFSVFMYGQLIESMEEIYEYVPLQQYMWSGLQKTIKAFIDLQIAQNKAKGFNNHAVYIPPDSFYDSQTLIQVTRIEIYNTYA